VTRIAVVTIAHGRHGHLERQDESLARGSRAPDERILVAMDDRDLRAWPAVVVSTGAAQGELPLAAARNLGVTTARDLGCDVVICLDVDCLVGTELVAAYADAVHQQPDVVWSGPVTYLDPPPAHGYDLSRLSAMDRPHPARPAPLAGETLLGARPELFWSLSFACSVDAWDRSGGFCEDYVGYGAEDTDFGMTVVDRGLRLGWLGAARAYHQWHRVSDPPVEHLDSILRNAATYHARWGTWPMEGWLRQFEQRGLVTHEGGRWRRAEARSAPVGPARPGPPSGDGSSPTGAAAAGATGNAGSALSPSRSAASRRAARP
jgi:GT2 family glycosyltransferase